MEDCHDEATENQMYHTLEFYIGDGKGVATALNKAIPEYPIQLIQNQCKVM